MAEPFVREAPEHGAVTTPLILREVRLGGRPWHIPAQYTNAQLIPDAEGGFGIVCSALDEAEQPVAIKKIKAIDEKYSIARDEAHKALVTIRERKDVLQQGKLAAIQQQQQTDSGNVAVRKHTTDGEPVIVVNLIANIQRELSALTGKEEEKVIILNRINNQMCEHSKRTYREVRLLQYIRDDTVRCKFMIGFKFGYSTSVHVHEFSSPYLVYEFAPVNLHKVISSQNHAWQLSESQIKYIVYQLLCGTMHLT